MDPIVDGIKKKYGSCMKLERVNYHDHTAWHDLLSPLGSPEFALLDSSKKVLYRWFGVVTADEFSRELDQLCFG
jgi:hypothetical protein